MNDGSQSITQFVYDQRGRLLQTLDARGSAGIPNATNANTPYATTFVYDGLGRVLAYAFKHTVIGGFKADVDKPNVDVMESLC